MTALEYVLLYSTLPQNGTYTMLDHIQHMALNVTGEVIDIMLDEQEITMNIHTEDASIDVVIDHTSVNIDSAEETIVVTEIENNIIVEEV